MDVVAEQRPCGAVTGGPGGPGHSGFPNREAHACGSLLRGHLADHRVDLAISAEPQRVQVAGPRKALVRLLVRPFRLDNWTPPPRKKRLSRAARHPALTSPRVAPEDHARTKTAGDSRAGPTPFVSASNLAIRQCFLEFIDACDCNLGAIQN